MTKRTTKKAKKQDRKSPRETDSQFVFRVRATETYSVSDNISQTPLRPQRDGTRCDADHSEINEGRESDSRRTAFACLPDVTVEAPKRSVSVSVLPAQVEVLVNRPLQHVAKSKGLVPDEPHRKRRRIDTACRAKTTQTSQDENSVEDDETLNDDSEAFETFEESNARDEVDEKEKRCVKSAATSKWGSAVKKQYEQVVAELEGRNGGVKMNSVSDRKKADREAEEDDEGREDFETGEPPVRKGAAVEASNATGVIETGRRCACGAETLTRSSRQKQATAGELERDNIDEDNTWNVESELKSKGRYERQFNEDTREQDRKTATATSIFRRSQYLRRLDPDGLPGEDPGTTLQQPGSIIRIALEANSMVHEPAQSKAPDRLTELTNAIAVEVFNNLKKDTFCISSYGISFVIGILEVNGSKASLKEVLKYGGFGKDGVPDCCTEVVSTLRRRGSRPQEVAVKSGLYVRDAVRYAGLRSPTRPSLQHVLTAEFKTADSSTASWNGVLFNTATFFTSWKFPFSKQATYKGIFHDQSGQKVLYRACMVRISSKDAGFCNIHAKDNSPSLRISFRLER
ncbi:uncharacterized protein LOC135389923 isoform X2 [Ornithodoros turicata]|uniref:uncharacterized protein LOC135389923 isoform X2 n=1 Tax=Ornithodoros turicata TaxID=34597 RepID=UPI003139A673